MEAAAVVMNTPYHNIWLPLYRHSRYFRAVKASHKQDRYDISSASKRFVAQTGIVSRRVNVYKVYVITTCTPTPTYIPEALNIVVLHAQENQ